MARKDTVKMRKRDKRWKTRKRRVIYMGLLLLLLWSAMKGGGIISRLGLGTGSLFQKNVGGGQGGFFNIGDGANTFSEGVYPDSLIELAKKNPEARQFVKNYPEKGNDRKKIDVSRDLTGGIPLFLQWDERWGYRQYGGDFMAVNGCGPTCLSMVWCGLTGKGDWNPYKVAEMAEEKGYYVKGQGSSWDLMMGGATELGLYAETVTFDEEHILGTLQQGNPIICVMGPGDFTTQGHFLVLTGVDDQGKILVHDPNSRKRSGQSWELKRLMGQIRNLWAYSV